MTIHKMFDQARESARGTLEAARQFVDFTKIPLPTEFSKDRRELANKRILASLKKLGMATHAEVRLLQSRIEKLESELKALKKSH